MTERSDPRHLVLARDAATRRVRRATAAAAVLTVGATGVFAAFAAASTHTKKAVTHAQTVARHVTRVVVRAAPAPPLIAVQAPTPAPAPAPVPAPVSPVAPQAYSPPVVVSGGS